MWSRSRMAGRSTMSCRWERAKEELLEKEDPLMVAAEVWVLDEGAYDEVDVEVGYDETARRLAGGRRLLAVDRYVLEAFVE